MNELFLNAILNLFAIQAAGLPTGYHPKAAAIVNLYLRNHLRIATPKEYSELFDEALDLHCTIDDPLTRQEQVRGLSRRLRGLLTRFEHYMVVLYCLELSCIGGEVGTEPVRILSEELDISAEVLSELEMVALGITDYSRLTSSFLLVNPPESMPHADCRILLRPELKASFVVYRIGETDSYILFVPEAGRLSADALAVTPLTPTILQPGFILRDSNGARIYHGEISAVFSAGSAPSFFLQAEALQFRYPGSDSGLHTFSVSETGGKLVGIMGTSGAGKSTLLGILNGQTPPDSGRLTINGIDIYQEQRRLEGVIGHVPQDDLLFEDLTVFDNLFYNASLCLADLSAAERTLKVEALLGELHQAGTRDLIVGSPMEKSISGGERKRLNIALELIREPSILFVDEPTSGLSSADSENVMALLKTQASKGKLVIVVIHQPSSRIFKMLDSVWLLDKGGRPVYTGNPLDAIVYFRKQIHQAGMDEYSCPHCGSVNPEQILEIIEAGGVDENGRLTKERRVSPEEWHRRHLAQQEQLPQDKTARAGEVNRCLSRPGISGQFQVFFQRTLKGRLHNRQYLLINLLEAPLLALVTALVCRGAWGAEYVFMENGNLANYFFISVIVALFMGMSVSAEEINRDRSALSRERLLHLSWFGYIASKTTYLAIVVALQTAMFTLVGNYVLRIPDMYLSTWAVLFSCSLLSCLLGLNISATFKSAVNIYILIPLLLVPQIILGGATVQFDELLHRDAASRNVPWAANFMPSRWGYEALLVRQYTGNRYMRQFFNDECGATRNDYMIQFHIPEIRALADYPLLETGGKDHAAGSAARLAALSNELRIQEQNTGIPSGLTESLFRQTAYTPEVRDRVKDYLSLLVEHYSAIRQQALAHKDITEKRLHDTIGIEGAQLLKQNHYNKNVAALALNTRSLDAVRLSGNRLVQVAAPICQTPESVAGQAHFMAAVKRIGTVAVSTPIFNLSVIWAMTAALFVTLQVRLLSGIMSFCRGSIRKK